MENTLVCTSPPVLKDDGSSRRNLILMSVGCICVLVLVFFVYRFVKNMNRRFSKLEEVISRLIEKNNQMHHQFIQQTPPPVVQNSSIQRPPIRPTNPTPPPVPVDLDAELQAELQELQVQKPIPVPVEETVTSPVVAEDDVPEGRVDK